MPTRRHVLTGATLAVLITTGCDRTLSTSSPTMSSPGVSPRSRRGDRQRHLTSRHTPGRRRPGGSSCRPRGPHAGSSSRCTAMARTGRMVRLPRARATTSPAPRLAVAAVSGGNGTGTPAGRHGYRRDGPRRRHPPGESRPPPGCRTRRRPSTRGTRPTTGARTRAPRWTGCRARPWDLTRTRLVRRGDRPWVARMRRRCRRGGSPPSCRCRSRHRCRHRPPTPEHALRVGNLASRGANVELHTSTGRGGSASAVESEPLPLDALSGREPVGIFDVVRPVEARDPGLACREQRHRQRRQQRCPARDDLRLEFLDEVVGPEHETGGAGRSPAIFRALKIASGISRSSPRASCASGRGSDTSP